jgi:hypothetical protein
MADKFDTFLDYILDPNTDKTKVNWDLVKQDFPDKNIDLMIQDFGITGSGVPLPRLSPVDPMKMQKPDVRPSDQPLPEVKGMSLGESLKKRAQQLAGTIESLPKKIPFPLAVKGGQRESPGAWWKPAGVPGTQEERYKSGMISMADFMRRFHGTGQKMIAENPEGNLLKTLYNAAVGGGQLLGSLPQFFLSDLPAATVRTVTPGAEGGIGEMGKEMVKDTADIIKYVYKKQAKTDEWRKWRNTPEGKRIETMINEEPLRPLMAPGIFAGLARKAGKMAHSVGDFAQAKRLGFSARDFIDLKRAGIELDAYERRLAAERGKVSERELPPGFGYQAKKAVLERPESGIDTRATKLEGDFAPFKKPEPKPKIQPKPENAALIDRAIKAEGELATKKIDNFGIRKRVMNSRKKHLQTEDLRGASKESLEAYVAHLNKRIADQGKVSGAKKAKVKKLAPEQEAGIKALDDIYSDLMKQKDAAKTFKQKELLDKQMREIGSKKLAVGGCADRTPRAES